MACCHGGHLQDVVLKTWGLFVNPRQWLTWPCSVVFIAAYSKCVILLSKWVTLNAAPCSSELWRGWRYTSASLLCLQRVSPDDLYLYIIQSTKFSQGYSTIKYYFVTERCPMSTGIRSKAPCSGHRIGPSTRSPFVTLLSQRAQSGRWSFFGKRVWFTESHIVLIISFFIYCFIYLIYCWYKIMERYIQLNN